MDDTPEIRGSLRLDGCNQESRKDTYAEQPKFYQRPDPMLFNDGPEQRKVSGCSA